MIDTFDCGHLQGKGVNRVFLHPKHPNLGPTPERLCVGLQALHWHRTKPDKVSSLEVNCPTTGRGLDFGVTPKRAKVKMRAPRRAHNYLVLFGRGPNRGGVQCHLEIKKKNYVLCRYALPS